MKSLLCLTLATVLVQSNYAQTPEVRFYDVVQDGLRYVCDPETQTARVTPVWDESGNPQPVTSEHIEIASGVTCWDGVYYRVTQIGESSEYNGSPAGVALLSYNTSVTSVTIPEGVTEICNFAFSHANSLVSVDLPSSLKRIDYGAFRDCNSLTSIHIPSEMEMIDDYAFYHCTNLESVSFGSCVNFTSIGSYAFDGCSKLQSIDIPPYVTTIGDRAFARTNIDKLYIPNDVTNIGREICAGCENLKEIRVGPGNKVYENVYMCNAIIDKEKKTLLQACQKTTWLPEYVTKIGYGAYAGSTFTAFEIPDHITVVDTCAFESCREMTSLTIPASVTTLGSWIVANASALESVYVYHQAPLSIRDEVFITPSWEWNEEAQDFVYNALFTPATLYVLAGTKEKYQAAEGWKDFSNIIEMEGTGIESVETGRSAIAEWYSLDGRRQTAPRKGLNIIRDNSGNVRKVLIK